jgi:hypothetical protein
MVAKGDLANKNGKIVHLIVCKNALPYYFVFLRMECLLLSSPDATRTQDTRQKRPLRPCRCSESPHLAPDHTYEIDAKDAFVDSSADSSLADAHEMLQLATCEKVNS